MITIRNYINKEIQYIKDHFANMTVKRIANTLNKEESSIYNAIRKLGLEKQKHNKWTDEEVEFLKANYINMTSEEIAHNINHTVDAINTMRDKLKLVRNSAWSDGEIEFLKNNFETTLFSELSKILGRTESAIRAKCFDLNLFKNTPWSDEELNFVRDNYMEMQTSDISQLLSRTMNAIELKAARMGLKKYPYVCDYHYFDNIDVEDKAYWLGFLTADGWINQSKKTNAGVTGIELKYGDINHLRKFNKSIGGNYKITDRWRACSISKKDKDKKHHVCCIRIFSMTMYNALKRFGFSHNKSYDFHIPDLPENLIRHYIRGYFDGDGCFCFTNQSFGISFITASRPLYEGLVGILEKLSIKTSNGIFVNEFGTTMYRPEICKFNDKIKFLDWIYQDCNIYLDRKYKKYLKVKNHYRNNDESLAS